jgi:hypothetical protein
MHFAQPAASKAEGRPSPRSVRRRRHNRIGMTTYV